MWRALKEQVLNILFPLCCIGCGREGELTCAQCQETLQFLPPCCFVCGRLAPERDEACPGRTCVPCRKKTALWAFLSPFQYEMPLIHTLIKNLKYKNARILGRTAALLLARYTPRLYALPADEMILVPIPLHPRRRRRRGFNQAALIAQEYALLTSLPVHTDLLQRIRSTYSQTTLSHEERLANIKGAFRVTKPEHAAGKTILLVDDVKTTGATLEEAARTLRKAGARKVSALTLAR